MGYNLYINGTRTDTRDNKKISSVVINNVIYSVEPLLTCTVSGLGSSSPSSVTFTNNTITNWTPEVVTKDNRSFVKFPTFYRKVNAVSSSQITSFSIANYKVDNDYQPYSCFVKEDGETVMDYVLVAVDFFSTSSTIADGRTTAQSYGTGYQLYDWQIHKLFQDLAICKLGTIDTNNGSGIASLLGINWGSTSTWIDGICSNASNDYWTFSYKPSKYVDSPTTSTDGYQVVNYERPTSNGDIQKLGYDTSNPFVNYTSAVVSNSSYNTYYCDSYGYASGSHPVICGIGNTQVHRGVFHCDMSYNWSGSNGARLCYRPISE